MSTDTHFISKLTKVARVRRSGYPVGTPAPMMLRCPCGAGPDAPADGQIADCSCGLRYNSSGYVQPTRADRQRQTTDDGSIKVGDKVTIKMDLAQKLSHAVYDGRKTADQIRAERTGRVTEIWTGGSFDNPWWMATIDCKAVNPCHDPNDLEIVERS